MIRALTHLVCVCGVFAGVGAVPGHASAGIIGNWWSGARARIDDGPATPPKPVAVSWGKRQLGKLELGTELADLAAADLDGDGKDEVVVLSAHEVLVFSMAEKRLRLRARHKLLGPPSLVRSRDPIGTVFVDGKTIRAATSEYAKGSFFSLENGGLVPKGEFEGVPECNRLQTEFAKGRNYYVRADRRGKAKRFYVARCTKRWVGPAGRTLHINARSGVDGILRVSCDRGGRCEPGPATDRAYRDVGAAFAVGDINRDGHPEVLTTDRAPAGAPDAVNIYANVDSSTRRIVREVFPGGVVSLAVGDIDGDSAAEAFAAVRTSTPGTYLIWGLNR